MILSNPSGRPLLSGVRCAICGMALENSRYGKEFDQLGNIRGLYWANPRLSELTDVRVDFCSAEHSVEWHFERMWDER